MAVATTRLLAHSVAEPAVPEGLVDGDPGAIDRFDQTVVRRLAVDDVKRIKIWNSDGRIVYSDDTRLIGEEFALGDDERAVLAAGGTEAEQSDLSSRRTRYERGSGGLLEVYTRIVVARGRAAALRGLLLRCRHLAAAAGGVRRLPADHAGRARGARARNRPAAVGAHPAAGPGRPGARAAAPRGGGRLRRRASADRARPARRSGPGPRRHRLRAFRGGPDGRRRRPPSSTASADRCGSRCAGFARCWSRSIHPT